MVTMLDRLRRALADRYHIERELGVGGMATVYLAHDRKHDRDVAVKVLRPELAESIGRDRFLREIQIAARLAHPHILPVFDSGDADGVLFYVMPKVEGQSLRERLTQQCMLPIDEAVRIAGEVAHALDYAHRHGVVHRDIKPENIMLQDELALVADFGIGKAFSAEQGQSLTTSGISVGTPAYMSPEQASGEAVDGRTDIYSLGCMLYEMLVGEQPFTGPTQQAVIARRFVQTPTDVSALRQGVPGRVAQAVQKSLAREPVDRFDTAGHFAISLHDLEASSATRAANTGAPHKSLAVLPFTNMSADPENEFFADGVTEEILNALAAIPDLRVAGRASAFSFKGKRQDLRTIGEQLHVRTVLEGSVRRSGTRVRITAQLSDATDGFRLWSERYDRDITDVFAVQDEIAGAIADKLKTALQGTVASRAQRVTDSIEAYEAYVKGRALIERRGASVREGVTLVRRALDLDPTYAPAWAGLADAYSVFAIYAMLPPDVCASVAREASAKALQFGPDLAETHHALAQVALFFDWDWTHAERSFRRALDINPGFVQAGAWYGLFYLGFVCGRWDDAIAHVLSVAAAEPLSSYVSGVVAYTMADGGHAKEAVVWGKRAHELDPTSYFSAWALQIAYHAAGQYVESIEVGERALAISGRMQGSLLRLATALVAMGDLNGARAISAELHARAGRESISRLNLAIVSAALGDTDTGLAYAREAFAHKDPEVVCYGRSDAAAALLELPEYRQLLDDMNQPRLAHAATA